MLRPIGRGLLLVFFVFFLQDCGGGNGIIVI